MEVEVEVEGAESNKAIVQHNNYSMTFYSGKEIVRFLLENEDEQKVQSKRQGVQL